MSTGLIHKDLRGPANKVVVTNAQGKGDYVDLVELLIACLRKEEAGAVRLTSHGGKGYLARGTDSFSSGSVDDYGDANGSHPAGAMHSYSHNPNGSEAYINMELWAEGWDKMAWIYANTEPSRASQDMGVFWGVDSNTQSAVNVEASLNTATAYLEAMARDETNTFRRATVKAVVLRSPEGFIIDRRIEINAGATVFEVRDGGLYLNGAPFTGGGGGLSQADADLRYAQLGAANTFLADQFINGKRIGKGIGTGVFNTVLGSNATLGALTTGAHNIGIGENALNKITTASNNVAVGTSALFNNTGSTGGNTALGRNALTASTTGYDNTAVGYNAGSGVTTGLRSTYIGASAGAGIITGSRNTIIGANSQTFPAALSDVLILGSGKLTARPLIWMHGNGNTRLAYTETDQPDSGYKLDVNGTVRGTELYEDTAKLSDKYESKASKTTQLLTDAASTLINVADHYNFVWSPATAARTLTPQNMAEGAMWSIDILTCNGQALTFGPTEGYTHYLAGTSGAVAGVTLPAGGKMITLLGRRRGTNIMWAILEY